MQNSLYVDATGMAPQQAYIDVIANNLANIITLAYKKDRVSVQGIYVGVLEQGAAGAVALSVDKEN